MNALRTSLRPMIQRNVAFMAGRRTASTALPKPPVPACYHYSFKKEWLEDASCYPMITIMTLITAFVIGMSGNALFRYKDLRYSAEKKRATIQNWGSEQQTRVVESLVKMPKLFNRQDWAAIMHEGLGVNHDEWVHEHNDAKEQSPDSP